MMKNPNIKGLESLFQIYNNKQRIFGVVKFD